MIIPNRGVGAIGLSTDLTPYDLPAKAWTDAINVRFTNDKIAPYSVFKELDSEMNLAGVPTGVYTHETPGIVTVVNDDGTIKTYRTENGTVQNDLTPAAPLNQTNDKPTSCELAGLKFINSPQSTPVYAKESLNVPYEYIPGWPSEDSAKVLRSFGDFLVAFNVSKGTDLYPTMVKWSDATQYGQPPQNWSVTDDASLAGENVLNEATGPILDASTIGSAMLVYTENETFRMDFIGGQFIFDFNNIARDRGVIATNCVASVSGLHYVFGQDEIYVHDGNSKKSLSDRRINRRVYDYIDYKISHRCFVHHDSRNSEVIFGFPSLYREDGWSNSDCQGCNEAAVYNYKDDTWTMVQLPSVTGMVEATVSEVSDWEALGKSWGNTPSNWTSIQGRGQPVIITACGENATENFNNKLLALDDVLFSGSNLDLTTDLVDPPFVERVYNDLDEIMPDLAGRKMVRSLFPQVDVEGESGAMELSLGSSRSPLDDTIWEPWRPFDPVKQYKHDSRVAGRYIGIRVRFDPTSYAQLSSLDYDVTRISRR